MQEFLDFDDLESPKARRERLTAEAEVRRQEEERVRAEAVARSTATTLRANESFLLAEYERAGVAPPYTNGRGVPTVSLALLLKSGWEVRRLGGDQSVLVRPSGPLPVRLQSEV